GESKRRALTGTRLDPQSPAVGFREAARDRQPQACTAGRVEPMERIEDPLALTFGNALAAVDDPDQHFFARGVDPNRHRFAQRRPSERVLEQIDERPLQLHGVDANDRYLLGKHDLDPGTGTGWERLERLLDQLVRRPQLESRCRGARL